jgi:hypothetical protein
VPIVGQALDVYAWTPVVSLACRCRTPSTPLLLTGLGTVVMCPHCRRLFAVTKVRFAHDRPDNELQVSLVGTAPAPPAPGPAPAPEAPTSD